MIKLVICDDEEYYLEKVKTLAVRNLKERNSDIQVVTCTSGKELCDNPEVLDQCQILFLDINMQDCNGVDIAHRIKQKYPDIYLVFVTAYMDYVLMGYRVEAFRFLLKDNLEDMMRECIDALLQKMHQENDNIVQEFADGERIIKAGDILYIESFRHNMLFHMKDNLNTVYEKKGKLGELEQELAKYGFCRIHKSYLVNMKRVEAVERYQVHLENNIHLTIPREKYQMVRDEYIRIMGEI